MTKERASSMRQELLQWLQITLLSVGVATVVYGFGKRDAEFTHLQKTVMNLSNSVTVLAKSLEEDHLAVRLMAQELKGVRRDLESADRQQP